MKITGWCFFVGWRSWWFLLYWNDGMVPGIPDFFWDGMTLDGPSLREIDSLVEYGVVGHEATVGDLEALRIQSTSWIRVE